MVTYVQEGLDPRRVLGNLQDQLAVLSAMVFARSRYHLFC